MQTPVPSTALITPSFRGDLERCRLLVESAERYVPASVAHYLVIDKRDQAMFWPLVDGRTELIVVEDIVPFWLRRIPTWVPMGAKVWLNLRGKPVRNWLLQQIVKLSTNTFATADRFVFVDSDVFFVAPWAPASEPTLFREEGPPLFSEFNSEWHRVAHRLLGLPEPTVEQQHVSYVGNLLSWRKSSLDQLQQHLTSVGGKNWVQRLAALPTLSEYVLYGVFVERVLGFETAQQWPESTIVCATEWGTQPLDTVALTRFKAAIQPHQVAAMVSAKSSTDVATIRSVFLP